MTTDSMRNHRKLALAVIAQAVKDRPRMALFTFAAKREQKEKFVSRLRQIKQWAISELARRPRVEDVDRFLASDSIWHDLAGVKGSRILVGLDACLNRPKQP